MAITTANLITNLDTFIGDTSTDRISQAERLQALTEAVSWLQEETGNDHMNQSATIDYFDTINVYKITSSVVDMLDPCQLRCGLTDEFESMSRKSSRELYEEIGNGFGEDSYALERVDNNWYLLINVAPKYSAFYFSHLESLTIDGGEWEVDSTDSDATNITVDTNEFTEGVGSLNFDIDVSQSANDRATIINNDLNSRDLSDYEDLASWLIDVYIPESADTTSITLYWGSSSSNYWSVTVTTDINGSTIADGWNTFKLDWSSATTTGTPDVTAITYFRIDINYDAAQGDDTDYRIDNLRLVRPEKLKFVYTSWRVGTSNAGTDIYAFTATNDVPYFSGQYDQYKFAVAHKAAAILFRTLRLSDKAQEEENEAFKGLTRIQKIIPSSRTPEMKSFKIKGLNFNRHR